jgi:hypothetical protein
LSTKVEGFKDGTGDKAKEAQVGFLVADGQAPVLLDPAKEHLTALAQGMEFPVVNRSEPCCPGAIDH